MTDLTLRIPFLGGEGENRIFCTAGVVLIVKFYIEIYGRDTGRTFLTDHFLTYPLAAWNVNIQPEKK